MNFTCHKCKETYSIPDLRLLIAVIRNKDKEMVKCPYCGYEGEDEE